ncbi:hypothetical protein MMC30_006809 [Trapelia coarctata]|nr:hypothetical protein [Trapelia coarctata]
MSEPTIHCQPSRVEEAILGPTNGSIQNAVTSVHDGSNELDHKGRTPAERHALFMTGFRNILQHEGLRSPAYYHDKSQYVSFQDCSPAERGIIKAERLKWGYIEPEDLAKRLRQLKPSKNFTLRKFRHPHMSWDKSPTPKTPPIKDFPAPDWVYYQDSGIYDLESRLGEPLTKAYRHEARKYWDKVADIELAPVPDISLLEHITHSPSGTLFPRYLVKALRELSDSVHKKGLFGYYDDLDEAKSRREETIRQWREEHPDIILVDDALSIYRTWPRDLMDRLDGIDQEALREGRQRYMDELKKAGQKMEEIVASWRNCGLITGIRTPPSPQWPDPKAKLRGRYKPQYVRDRREKIQVEFGSTDEGQKRSAFVSARWKEAVLNSDSDPLISEMPLTESLLKEFDVIWSGWKSFIDTDDVEEEIIDMLGRRRRGEEKTPCSESSGTPEPDSGADISYPQLSQADHRALREAVQLLREGSRKPRDPSGAPWLSRLRPLPQPPGASRQQARNPKKPPDDAPGVKPPISPMHPASEHLDVQPQTEPSTVTPRRAAKTHSSSKRARQITTNSSRQGVRKTRKAESKSGKAQ